MSFLQPLCVAETSKSFNENLPCGRLGDVQSSISNCFRGAIWSPDGTSIITTNEDNTLRTFVVPPNLLSAETPHTLVPYSQLCPGEPIYAYSAHPRYDLSNPNSTLILSSVRDHPIRLTNALAQDPEIIASYPLVSPTTEIYHAPHSLLFTATGSHFVAGSDSLIATFDVNRSHEEPVSRVPTIPSRRKKMKGGGVGMKGLVSSLDISNDGTLAAGTFTRSIGLYSNEGRGDCVAIFSVAGQEIDGEYIRGSGVTEVLWSPCGRYLNIAERKSDGIMVYDIRVAGKLLCWLKGRKANTNQRLGIDVIPTPSGFEVWAGGTDGVIRYWKDIGQREGVLEAAFGWKGHNDVVSSAVVHQSGTVVATTSGQRYLARGSHDHNMSAPEDHSSTDESDEDWSCNDSSDERKGKDILLDNSLRIWSL